MSDVRPDWIAVDWGTSNMRAWAMSASGTVLAEARARGDLSEPSRRGGACHLYTSFRRRFGRNRAPCLRGHGARPPQLDGGAP